MAYVVTFKGRNSNVQLIRDRLKGFRNRMKKKKMNQSHLKTTTVIEWRLRELVFVVKIPQRRKTSFVIDEQLQLS